jgi:hypothetical protein
VPRQGSDRSTVAVRSIRPVGGRLWAVQVRTGDGRLHTMVVAEDLATSGTVAMAAHVVGVLSAVGKIPPTESE